MKFTEFKQSQEVQLTEEQEIIISYCEGSITKKDAVNKLKEAALQSPTKQSKTSDWFKWNDKGDWSGFNWGGDWRDQLNKATLGAVDSRDAQDAQDAEAAEAEKTYLNTRRRKRFRTGDKEAQAAPPKDPKPGVNIDPIIPKTGAAGDMDAMVKQVKPERPTVKATAANTRDYDKTLALQKKLIAQGAKIDADGLMGPKTRAAMKAAGMSTSTPGSKVKQPGPSVKQNPEYSNTGMDPINNTSNAKPKIRTDMPGGPTRKNAFKSVYNKATPDQKKAMITRLQQAVQAKRNAPPKPTKKKPAPKNILGGTKNLLKPDDPRGGEVVAQLPKWLGGGKIKTLPQQRDDSSGE